MYGLQIVIGDKELTERKRLKSMLIKNGYGVIGEAGDGIGAMRYIRGLQPDLAILDSQLPGQEVLDLWGISAEDHLPPIILTAPNSNKHILQKAKEGWVFGLLIKPIEEEQMVATIEIAVANHQKLANVDKEMEKLTYQLKARKLVEKAKGILMRAEGVTEEEAFKWLRQQSMDKRKSMETVAEAIILSHQMKADERR
jgi:response regulator NasT